MSLMPGHLVVYAKLVRHGCIRDSVELATLDIGIKALAIQPLRSFKRGVGELYLCVVFNGVSFNSGDYIYSDEDGMITSAVALI